MEKHESDEAWHVVCLRAEGNDQPITAPFGKQILLKQNSDYAHPIGQRPKSQIQEPITLTYALNAVARNLNMLA